MDNFRKVLETLWVGSLLFVAGFMTWMMYHERATGGLFAGHLFPSVSVLGVVIGTVLLLTSLWLHGAKSMKTLAFWLVFLMLAMSVVNWLGVASLLARLGMDANFKLWHAIGTIIYLLECVLGTILVIQRR